MGQRLEPNQFALYKRIDKILWLKWDPAQVHSIHEARDEYYCYLFPLLNIVTNGATKEQISNYLYDIEQNIMALPGDRGRCDLAATLIVDSAKKIYSKLN